MKQVSYPVKGMTCAACVSRVEKVLKKVEGIKEVSVNLANEKAYITIDDNTDIKTASSLLQEYGYQLVTDEKNQDGIKNESSDYIKLKKDFR